MAEAEWAADEEKARADVRWPGSCVPHELQERGRERVTRDREEAGSLEELDADASARARQTLGRETKDRRGAAPEALAADEDEA